MGTWPRGRGTHKAGRTAPRDRLSSGQEVPAVVGASPLRDMPCCRPARPVLRRARPRDAAIQQPHPSRLLRTSGKGGKAGTARVDASKGSRHRRVAAATARTVGARSEATAASPARGRLPHPRSPRGVARCSAPVWPSLRMTGRGSVVAPLGPSRRRPAPTLPLPAPQDEREEAFSQTRPGAKACGGLEGLRYIPRLRPVVVAQYGGRERRRLTRSFETPPALTIHPRLLRTSGKGARSTSGRMLRQALATGESLRRQHERAGGGGAHSWRPDRRLQRGHSRVGRGTPRLQEPDWERITVD